MFFSQSGALRGPLSLSLYIYIYIHIYIHMYTYASMQSARWEDLATAPGRAALAAALAVTFGVQQAAAESL